MSLLWNKRASKEKQGRCSSGLESKSQEGGLMDFTGQRWNGLLDHLLLPWVGSWLFKWKMRDRHITTWIGYDNKYGWGGME
jgi:hypothetical protein